MLDRESKETRLESRRGGCEQSEHVAGLVDGGLDVDLLFAQYYP